MLDFCDIFLNVIFFQIEIIIRYSILLIITLLRQHIHEPKALRFIKKKRNLTICFALELCAYTYSDGYNLIALYFGKNGQNRWLSKNNIIIVALIGNAYFTNTA